MKTGKIIVIFIAALFTIRVSAQEKNWLWPIEEHAAGDNILFVPQQYIENELNFDNIFIGGEEGASVLVPTNATVSDFSLHYSNSFSYSTSFTFDEKISVQDNLRNAREELDPKSHDADYLTGGISLAVQIHDNGDGSGDVDDGEQHHKCREYFL